MARELQLIYADAAVELGIAGPDRVVSAEDASELARIYRSVWAILDDMDLATWDQDGPVPDGEAQPLAWVLAFHAGNAFGLTADRMERLRTLGQLGGVPSLGERLLRKLAAPDYIEEPMQVESF